MHSPFRQLIAHGHRFSLLTLPILLLVLASARAQDSAALKQAAAERTAVAPVIDGRLDDEVWRNATVIEDLHQVTPVEFATPTERTVVYLLYDADNLYVGARMFDRETRRCRLRARVTGR
jgi:hypothetical protein